MADTKSVTAGSNATSDAFTLQTDTVAAWIQFKADNSTTPAADDVIVFKVLESIGDIDNDTTEDYGTIASVPRLAVLDTNNADPQVSDLIPLPVSKKLKVYADGGEYGTTNAITVSAMIRELAVDGSITDSRLAWT